MITYGNTQIEEAYIGETELGAIHNARTLINNWDIYSQYNDEEILKLLLDEDLEFDLVKIEAPWKGVDLDLKEKINLYNNHSLPPAMYTA